MLDGCDSFNGAIIWGCFGYLLHGFPQFPLMFDITQVKHPMQFMAYDNT